ncbi:MAG TPA: electron transfer flavoprotein subunit beta/FixA family protein [Firmicutes bacterium]|jgi:electron transfer flavoprotein beta subunit|nr:electron transfer flavoprotein subunit beta/FixA family protein [Bacillota bacterium]
MNLVVLVKQVPETTDVRIDRKTNTLIREGVSSIVNPFDMYAVEQALQIRDEHGGRVTCISMGPPQAEAALRETLALGADEAILLSDKAFAGADTLATSYTLAEAILKLGEFDLVICGKQAIDGDTAQVGPGVAEHLDIPHVTYVSKVEEISNRHIRVRRMTEEGYDVILSSLPALITVVREIGEPRMPSIKGTLRARKAQVITWTAGDLEADELMLGLSGSPTQVARIFSPEIRPGGEIIEGDSAHEKARNLLARLKESHLL